jgi:hypothetical protein
MQPHPVVPSDPGFRASRRNPNAFRTLRRAAPRRVFGDT